MAPKLTIAKRCTACKEALPSNGNFVSCLTCDGGFHFGCITDLNRAEWRAKSEAEKREWLCMYCRKDAQQHREGEDVENNGGINITTSMTHAKAPPANTQTSTPCHLCGKLYKTRKGLQGHIAKIHSGADTATNCLTVSSTPEPFHTTLAASRRHVRVIPRIPKGARILAAEQLAATISAATTLNNEASWQKLLRFTYATLRRPEIEKKVSLTTQVKNNLNAFPGDMEETATLHHPENDKPRKTRSSRTSTKRAEAKISEGDVRGAVRLLCSEDDVAPFTPETAEKLREKHPSARQDTFFPNPPLRQPQPPSSQQSTQSRTIPPLHQQTQRTTVEEIREAVRSFPPGSAGGLDGLRPQHLKDLLSNTNGEAADKLVKALAGMVDLMLDGLVPEEVCPYLYGATLTALKKKDGGIRPIAVGNTFRRLAAKIGCRRVQSEMGAKLRPHQLGFGTPGGAEAAVHAARRFVEDPEGGPRVLLKMDFKNAFNALHRDHMLHATEADAPTLFPFAWQCYRNPSVLSFGEWSLESADGCQQGDPTGPLLFCIGLQPLCKVLRSPLNMWYLDDGTLGGPLSTILDDVKSTLAYSDCSGLEVNPSKCEVFLIGHTPEEEATALASLEELLPGVRHVQRPDLCLLGSPLTEEAIPIALQDREEAAARMGQRLQEWSAHYALFVLKNCLAIPKLIYIIRTCPSWLFGENLKAIDEIFRSILERICNTSIEGNTWRQATLPVGKGGLGIRRIEELAIPAFLGSSYSTGPLVSEILSRAGAESVENVAGEENLRFDKKVTDAERFWMEETERLSGVKLERPQFSQRGVQKRWDAPLVKQRQENLIEQARQVVHSVETIDLNPKSESHRMATANVARLLATATNESGQWIQVLPSPPLGTFLDPDTLRVAVALRLGAPICAEHVCRCGASTNVSGHHGLSCKLSAGRHPRHHALNEVIRRALVTAGVPSRLEPTGLSHDAGLRADGLTLVPWSGGKSLTWDVTCVDTFAASHVPATSRTPRAAANVAEEKKREKYRSLTDRYIFAPLGFETMGAYGESSLSLVNEIGKRISIATGENRATEFLRQRISVEIQRGNAMAIFGTFPPSKSFDEMFLLL